VDMIVTAVTLYQVSQETLHVKYTDTIQ